MFEENDQNKMTEDQSLLAPSAADAVAEAEARAKAAEEQLTAAREAEARTRAAEAEALRAAQLKLETIRQENEEREASERKEAARKKRRNKTLKISALILGIVLLVGAAGYAVGNLFRYVSDLKERASSTEDRRWFGESESVTPSEESEAAKQTKEHEAVIPSGETRENPSTCLPDVSDIVADAMPSVVTIVVKQTVTSSSFFGEYQYETSGAGSGIIIGDNGTELWVVTNYHVVEDSKEISVTFCDEEACSAYIKGTSAKNDLAVLGIDLSTVKESTKSEIRAITMGDSDSLRLGEGVIAIGNALGWGQSVTIGVVSALNRQVTFDDETSMYLMQVSAAINPGNSGGALLNGRGELVGINNAKYSDTDVEGIGFAIPISSIKEIMEELSLMEPRIPVAEEDYPYLGVSFKELSSNYMNAYGIPKGAYIYSVGEDTPAAKAGLLPYDIITAINGVEVDSYEAFRDELQYYPGGTEVELTVERLEKGRYQEETIEVKLGFKKDYQQ